MSFPSLAGPRTLIIKLIVFVRNSALHYMDNGILQQTIHSKVTFFSFFRSRRFREYRGDRSP